MSRIKQTRESLGLSQRDLGKKIGVTAMSISRYEQDEDRLYPSLIIKLADALGVTPPQLVGWDAPPPIDIALLAHAICLADDWLSRQGRTADPDSKARITAALYETALRDRCSGGDGRVSIEPLEPVLSLLAV